MKLKWKKYPIYWDTYIAKSGEVEYRIEKTSGLIGIEINAKISDKFMGRTLGWCPSIKVAKDRCQQMEDYFNKHKVSLR